MSASRFTEKSSAALSESKQSRPAPADIRVPAPCETIAVCSAVSSRKADTNSPAYRISEVPDANSGVSKLAEEPERRPVNTVAISTAAVHAAMARLIIFIIYIAFVRRKRPFVRNVVVCGSRLSDRAAGYTYNFTMRPCLCQ